MTAHPTTLGYALLGLLHQGPRSGYDLRKVFATTALGNYSSSPGAIYPALARLERAKLIDGRVDQARSLRPRMLYQPTKAGSAAMRRWLTQPISHEDVERRIDELMLRFAFLWILEDRRRTERFLVELAEQVDAYVTELKRQRSLHPPETPIQPRLALEAGIEQYQACARWARKALIAVRKERT